MTDKNIKDVFENPYIATEKGKQERYLYSLRHMALKNAEGSVRPLTGLHDLGAFFFLCGETFREHQDLYFGIIVMDITQFKAVNELFGRTVGDNLLLHIAGILGEYEQTRPFTHATHIRADNFALVTPFEKPSDLSDIAMEIKQAIHDFPLDYRVHPSFGIYATYEKNPTASFMKDCASVALSQIKGKFYADYAFFDNHMRAEMLRERQIENDISRALEAGELVPYIQPKVDMRTGEIIGGEALVRWVTADNRVIPPADFLPTLEKNGFIIQVDREIWRQVFAYLQSRIQRNKKVVPVSVNISRLHIFDDMLCETLIRMQEEYQVPKHLVPLELTESAMMDNSSGILERMRYLREQGFLVSMDDFGTGYSSMLMLRDHPVDEVKLDRSFILDLQNERSRTILEHLSSMLRSLHEKIIVEGVETEEQRQILIQNGLEKTQGFLFYKPMPIEEFDKLLDKEVPDEAVPVQEE